MGIVEIIAGVSLAISIASIAYAAVAMPKNKSKNKQEIGDFQVTKAEEGQVISLVYGNNVRVSGSIVWYGNVSYTNIKAKGGKGGGGGGGSAGYRTFCDCHIVLCEGKVSLEGIYKDEEVYDYAANASITFNDGTTSSYYAYDEYANKLSGIAHIFFKTWYLGDNTNAVPNLSFKVTRELVTPLTCYTTTGENPANIIYDLITRVGGICDITSFQEVATYFNDVNWGLNLVFDSQEETGKLIERVQEHVDIIVYKEAGVYYLKQAHSPIYIMDINERDMKDFVFTRVAYNQIFNDLSANYKDENNTERTVSLANEAIVNITGERKNHTYELKGFNNLAVLRARFCELFDRDTYPFSEVQFKVSLKYYDLLPGDLIGITYSPMSLDKQYIVIKIVKDPFKGEVEITAREYAPVTQGDYPIGTPKWEDINLEPVALDNVKVIPIRYGKYRVYNGKLPVLIMPEKKLGVEFSYDVYFSRDGVSYEFLETSYTFAYTGTLKEDYSKDTRDIDPVGFEFLYDATGYSLSALNFSELFITQRVMVIDNELMKFQEAEEIPDSDNVQIKGVLRGSNKENHYSESLAYITEIQDNVFKIPITETSYFKICPRTARGVLDVADATEISITPSIDLSPSFLRATRNGSLVTLEIFPNSQSNYGAGYGDANLVTDSIHPQKYEGSLLLSVNGSDRIGQISTIYSVSDANEVTFEVWQTAYGFISESVSLTVGIEDGEYIS